MRADLIVSRTRCSASSALLRRAGTTRGQIRWTPGEEHSAAGYQLPGPPGPSRCKKPSFYWAFHHGTAFADPSVLKQKAALCGICRSSAMLLALGAVSSALDALQSLTSSKSAAPQSTGFGQSSTNPFDFSGS